MVRYTTVTIGNRLQIIDNGQKKTVYFEDIPVKLLNTNLSEYIRGIIEHL